VAEETVLVSSYLRMAKEARRDNGSRETCVAKEGCEKSELSELRVTDLDEGHDRQGRYTAKPGWLTVEEVLEEMARPKTGPGLQARLYRAGGISKKNAVEWISCAIIYRREGGDASFRGWRRHSRAVERALEELFD